MGEVEQIAVKELRCAVFLLEMFDYVAAESAAPVSLFYFFVF